MDSTLISAALTNGVLNGALYALLALAVVLVFRTTGVANFAQGEMGMFSAFVLFMLVLPTGIPVFVSWIVTILLSGLLAALVYVVLLRLRPAGHLNLTVRTLGLYTLISAVATFLWGAQEPYRMPDLFPRATIAVGGLAVGYDQIGVLAIGAVAAICLLCVFRYTEIGLAMRACAMNAEIASLLGVNVRLVAAVVWAIAGMVGAVAGLLTASISFLDTSMMRPYILKALTAATIGGLTSFPGTIVGGFILGIVEAFASIGISVQMRDPVAFAILLLVLLLRPSGLFVRTQRTRV